MIIKTNWHKCHGKGWTGIITPESFAHPAKFSRALIRRIYAHALEQGYIAPGAIVVDPFGGVALGALHAMQNGLHWVAMELEEKFVVLGRANIDLWNARYSKLLPGWGTAQLLQGDSRRLAEALGAAGLVVSSPPYAGSAVAKSSDGVDLHKQFDTYQAQGGGASFEAFCKTQRLHSQGYGDSDGQLSALPLGNHAVVIGSPPWEQSLSRDRVDKADRVALARELGIPVDQVSAIDMENIGQRKQEYGATPGQMGSIVVGSPPHGSNAAHGRSGPIDAAMFDRQPGKDGQTFACEDYGDTPAQMGGMPSGDLAAVLSSPVYPGCLHGRGGIDTDKLRDGDNPPGPNSQALITNDYGHEPGQLGTMVLGSPPHLNTLASDDPDKRGGLFRDPKRRDDKTLTAEYGDEPGQLGAMRAGALVGSPPWESVIPSQEKQEWHQARASIGRNNSLGTGDYGASDNQLGQEKGDTFWSCAQTIMRQCHEILSPGSVAIWVLKAFVRNKAIVDFPGQWQQLGEACGFETIEIVRAWLVEDRGAQYGLFGGLDERKVERKSFFRRLAEKRARAVRHWEDVGRNEKARHLWASHAQLWEIYDAESTAWKNGEMDGRDVRAMIDRDAPPKKPTPNRILSNAQTMAYVEAGEPDIEIDTAIDFEIVLIQRKPHPLAVTK